MSKFGRRLIKAVKEALRAARCNHDWLPQKHPQQRMTTCRKCGCVVHFVEAKPHD